MQVGLRVEINSPHGDYNICKVFRRVIRST